MSLAAVVPAPDDGRMTLVEHLEELRGRLLRALLAYVGALVVAAAFYRELVDVVTLPHFRAMGMLADASGHFQFIATTYTAPVVAMMKLTMIAATFLAAPAIGWQAWAFVRSGLHPHERHAAAAFAPASLGLFALGVVFGYFVLVPFSLYGMASLLPLDQVRPMFSFAEYLDLVATMTILLGVVFQLPLVMLLLTRLGIAGPATYRRFRAHATVANLVLAGILSPPDLVSMAVFAVPLLLLYEVGAFASRWTVPDRAIVDL